MGLRHSSALVLGITALGGLLSAAPARAQQTAFAIANGGTNLISFATNTPGTLLSNAAFTIGGSTTAFIGGNTVLVSLDAIDFRASTGVLYGYWDLTDTVYSVNTATGALTAVVSAPGATSTNLLGMDFNPTTGGGTGSLFRVVTEATENVVFNVAAPGAPNVTTPLFYPAGDPNANAPLGARVVENAYTNNLPGAATTQQFGIDYGLDILVTIANNAGTLGTVGSLGVNVNDSAPFVGFDVFTALGGGDTAYAILDTTAGLAPTFYTINLSTGAASSVGAIGGGAVSQVYSLAVTAPGIASVAPEPGSLAMLATGLLGFGGMIARRRRRA